MKKLMLSWTLVLAVAGLTFMSCGKDKDDNNKPKESNESTFKDTRDSKVYKTIKIGDQTWFAENLAYEGTLSVGSSSRPYSNLDSATKYGMQYTVDAAKVACPNGWHLPSDGEWKVLEKYLGMSDVDLDKVGYDFQRGKDKNIASKLNKGGTSKFESLNDSGTQGIYWTSTSVGFNHYARSIFEEENAVYRFEASNGNESCIRCLQNK
jgi:uncharacterized protein (TIGR02145 family)